MLKWGMIIFSISLAVWEGEENGVIEERGSPCGCGWKRKVNAKKGSRLFSTLVLRRSFWAIVFPWPLVWRVWVRSTQEPASQNSIFFLPSESQVLPTCNLFGSKARGSEKQHVGPHVMMYFFLLEYDLRFHRTTVSRPCDIVSKDWK